MSPWWVVAGLVVLMVVDGHLVNLAFGKLEERVKELEARK